MGKLKKLKASTLLESMVAMMIVMMCLGFFSMIYVNIMNSDNNRQKLKISLLLKTIANQTIKESKFIDEQIKQGDITIEKKIETYENTSNLKLIKLTANNENGNTINQYKQLVIVQNEK